MRKTLFPIFSLLVFLPTLLFSEDYQKSSFLWSVHNKNPYRGKCYEVDSETYGKKYTYKVRDELCRPKDTISLWVPKANSYDGKCYEVDTQTKGSLYSKRDEEKRCYPKSYSYHFLKESTQSGKCIMIDDLTGGQAFSYKVNLRKCKTKKLIYRFKLSKKQDSGDCYELDAATNGESYIKEVPINKCKPAHVEYQSMKKSKYQGIICYEIDAVNGHESYIKKVSMKNCYKKNIQPDYVWIKSHAKLSPGCYERNILDGDKIFHKRINTKFCRPITVENIFVKTSPTKGICYEVDSKTFGNEFKNRLNLSSCNPGPDKTINIRLKKYCFTVDEKTRGSEYIEKINIKNCADTTTITKSYKWIPKKDNIYQGRCILENDKYKESFKTSYCKPKLTLYKWHNTETLTGQCYEIDAEYGPKHFSVRADRDKCRPASYSYRYYKKPKEIAGRCYKVDSKTLGENYYKTVKNELCQ